MSDLINPVGPRHPNAMISDQAKNVPEIQEEEFEEGTEIIPLPSKGVWYPQPFFCKEETHCRPMDFRDEDILTTQRYIEEGTVFDKIVTAVIQDKGLTAQKLVPVDRDTILIWLRVNALGKTMSVDYTCVNPRCKHKNTATWDLSSIEIPQYDPEILKQLQEKGEFEIMTPQKEIVVFLKVPLIEESKDTEKKFLKKKENDKIEHDLMSSAMLSLIVAGVKVDDKIIRKKDAILEYFKKIKLPLGDLRYIRSEAEKINLKYKTEQDLICSKCGHVQEGVSLPIVHQNFLWSDGNA